MPTKRVSVYLTRDYYFKSDLSTVCHTQESYKKYLTSLFQQTETILRRPKNADLVYDIDKTTRRFSKPKLPCEMQANYNKMAVTDLVKTSNIGWGDLLLI
jgi:hypothetical protein